MLKKNNYNLRGGSAVKALIEIFILITILSLIAFVGYKYYNSNKEDTTKKKEDTIKKNDIKEWDVSDGNCISGCIDNPSNDGTCTSEKNKNNYDNLNDAKQDCLDNSDCDGIYLDSTNKYHQRMYCYKTVEKYPNAVIKDDQGKNGTYFWCNTDINKDKKGCNTGQGGKTYFKP